MLHLDRRRYYGHPALVDYIQRLAKAARKAGQPTLLIGDLSQVRGGPTPTGHRSHQSGLDVDIGFTAPPWMAKRKMTAIERETMFAPAVVDLKTGTLTSSWNAKVPQLIALAAQDPGVNRIFVHPAVKRQLCDASPAGKRPPWLRLVRPWWGHHDHLHVRLSCPQQGGACTAQDALPPGRRLPGDRLVVQRRGAEGAHRAAGDRVGRAQAARADARPLPGADLRYHERADREGKGVSWRTGSSSLQTC